MQEKWQFDIAACPKNSMNSSAWCISLVIHGNNLVNWKFLTGAMLEFLSDRIIQVIVLPLHSNKGSKCLRFSGVFHCIDIYVLNKWSEDKLENDAQHFQFLQGRVGHKSDECHIKTIWKSDQKSRTSSLIHCLSVIYIMWDLAAMVLNYRKVGFNYISREISNNRNSLGLKKAPGGKCM